MNSFKGSYLYNITYDISSKKNNINISKTIERCFPSLHKTDMIKCLNYIIKLIIKKQKNIITKHYILESKKIFKTHYNQNVWDLVQNHLVENHTISSQSNVELNQKVTDIEDFNSSISFSISKVNLQ